MLIYIVVLSVVAGELGLVLWIWGKYRNLKLKQGQTTELDKIMEIYRFVEFGRLASGLFHDFANPLTTVSLNFEILDEEAKKVLADNPSFQRAMDGVKQLNLFFEAIKKQIKKSDVEIVFEVIPEIEQVVQVMKNKALVKNIDLTVIDHSNAKAQIYGNVFRFHQVLTNLISNAIDAYDGYQKTDEGTEENEVEIEIALESRHLVINVKDWGKGMNQHTQKKMFEPFYTTKGVDAGSGLGLYITKKIVEQDFKGKLECVSQLGKGTVFSFTLPAKIINTLCY